MPRIKSSRPINSSRVTQSSQLSLARVLCEKRIPVHSIRFRSKRKVKKAHHGSHVPEKRACVILVAHACTAESTCMHVWFTMCAFIQYTSASIHVHANVAHVCRHSGSRLAHSRFIINWIPDSRSKDHACLPQAKTRKQV